MISVAHMFVLRLFLVMVALTPIRGLKDYLYRWELAEAIVETVPEDEHKQDVMARLAWYEGSFRRAVAKCEIKGDKGKSKGFGQVQPMSAKDHKLACGTLPEQAEVVSRYLDRSADMCPKNEGAAKLNLYCSGRCDRGLAQAKQRWGDD